MIRFRGTVTYNDGQTVHYDVGTRGLIAWEAYARRNGIVDDATNPVVNAWTRFAVIAHYGITGTEEGFAAWLDNVSDVDPSSDPDDAAVPPTLREALAG